MTKLLYQGHSSFRIITNNNKVIYIDPYAGTGYDLAADLILVTHEHYDHNQITLPSWNANCLIIRSKDAIVNNSYINISALGINIRATEAYNSFHKKEECVGFLLQVDGRKLYFAGDTSMTNEMEQMPAENIDYAFLPVDGKFNMDGIEALKCADLIKPKYVVPIHTDPNSLFNLEKAESLKSSKTIILKPCDTIEW